MTTVATSNDHHNEHQQQDDSDNDQEHGSFCIVRNIPSSYTVSCLRRHFEHMINVEAFEVFHFLARPERVAVRAQQQPPRPNATREPTACTIVKLSSPQTLDEFIGRYHARAWTDEAGDELPLVCVIERMDHRHHSAIVVSSALTTSTPPAMPQPAAAKSAQMPGGAPDKTYLTRAQRRIGAAHRGGVPLPCSVPSTAQLKPTLLGTATVVPHTAAAAALFVTESKSAAVAVESLPELCPPSSFPRGNVGTPMRSVLEAVRRCLVPPSVLRKMGFELGSYRPARRYAAVPYPYSHTTSATTTTSTSRPPTIPTQEGPYAAAAARDFDAVDLSAVQNVDRTKSNEEARELPSDDDLDAEDWERYEALHDEDEHDEPLFEERIELQWEKGGSGLVFWTDACFWHSLKEHSKRDDHFLDLVDGDDGDGRSNRDNRNQTTVTAGSKRRYQEYDDSVGSFERHTRGVASRIMMAQGWRPGSGLGPNSSGIARPIEPRTQTDHSGLGFAATRESHVERQRLIRQEAKRQRVIRTVFDRFEREDCEDGGSGGGSQNPTL